MPCGLGGLSEEGAGKLFQEKREGRKGNEKGDLNCRGSVVESLVARVQESSDALSCPLNVVEVVKACGKIDLVN